jgi:tryptophan synthase alpha chain
LLELGIPFSDPIADGPTIQRSTQQALEQGMSTQKCLEMVQILRQQGVETPVMLMGYYNPMLAYGLEKFVAAAAAVGADGFIVPDLPPEEAAELEALAQQQGLVLVHFLAPTSNSGRIESVTQRAQGFIYMVSLTGITGARAQVAADLEAFIGRVRSQTKTPLAVGFGISTPEQAHQVGELADGVIVGSALINAVDKVPPAEAPQAAAHFIQTLQKALQKG